MARKRPSRPRRRGPYDLSDEERQRRTEQIRRVNERRPAPDRTTKPRREWSKADYVDAVRPRLERLMVVGDPDDHTVVELKALLRVLESRSDEQIEAALDRYLKTGSLRPEPAASSKPESAPPAPTDSPSDTGRIHGPIHVHGEAHGEAVASDPDPDPLDRHVADPSQEAETEPTAPDPDPIDDDLRAQIARACQAHTAAATPSRGYVSPDPTAWSRSFPP